MSDCDWPVFHKTDPKGDPRGKQDPFDGVLMAILGPPDGVAAPGTRDIDFLASTLVDRILSSEGVLGKVMNTLGREDSLATRLGRFAREAAVAALGREPRA